MKSSEKNGFQYDQGWDGGSSQSPLVISEQSHDGVQMAEAAGSYQPSMVVRQLLEILSVIALRRAAKRQEQERHDK